MSADFWAGYLSGAIGIIIGNPLDVVKVRLQAGRSTTTEGAWTPSPTQTTLLRRFENASSLVRGWSCPKSLPYSNAAILADDK